MQSQHRINPSLMAACIATALGMAAPIAAQATVLSAEANYNRPGTGGPGLTPVSGSPQTSATSVDVLDFFNDGNVSFGVHTYGSATGITRFGNRVSADIYSGTDSYDLDGTFQLNMDDVGDSFTFNVIPGEIAAMGSAGFVIGDFTNAHLNLAISVNGQQVFMSDATASSNAGAVSASFTGEDLGYNCSSTGGAARCGVSGGSFTLDLPSLVTGASSGDTFNLEYILFAEVHGNISQTYSDCGSGGGGIDNGSFDLEFVGQFIGDGSGNDGGPINGPCGSIARSGDPIPEPGTLALAGMGIAALSAVRRKRRNKR